MPLALVKHFGHASLELSGSQRKPPGNQSKLKIMFPSQIRV